jgi:hypothetical protein
MRDSERYIEQAEAVMRMAGKAASDAERDVYLSIADGWRRLAAEASRSERRATNEPRLDTRRRQEG